MTPNPFNTDHVEDIIKDDQKGRDEQFVDDLLSKELLQLSVKDRNDIQEEIHGVKCLAVEETPELIRKKLKELSEEIEKNIPESQKQAYLQSLQYSGTCPNSIYSSSERDSSAKSSISEVDSNPKGSYIHGDDFRLRFLRCELFDVSKAAKRFVTYLDMLVELFGDYALRRPICISDFTKEELRHMRKGMIQNLPYRDRSGRRIMICFPEEEVSKIPPFVKAKIAMYMMHAAGDQDTVTQKMGVIVVAWFDRSFAKLSTSWKIKYKFYTMNCDRITAIHCCSPDTPHYRIRRSVMVMRSGKENLNKLIFHLGEAMEIHYKLQGYGIPFEHVPISWTGKVKVQYLKQWMRIRQAIEQPTIDDNSNRSSSSNNNKHETGNSSCSDGSCDETSVISSVSQIIECPQLQDVVFRQGTSGTSNPGNVTFRSLIEKTVMTEKYLQFQREQKLSQEQQEEQQKSGGNSYHKPPKSKSKTKSQVKRPKQLAFEIYKEQIRTGDCTGRFLIYNNDKGWWNAITDREQICMKIEYMVREFQKQMSKGKLSSIKGNKKKDSNRKDNSRKSISSQDGVRYNHNTDDSSAPVKNVIYLQSGTTLFQSQDGGSYNPPFFANKKQRLNFLDHDTGHGGNSDFGSSNFGKNKIECFGMSFAPCLT